MRIFENKNYIVEGNVLSKDGFRLARELKEYKVDERRVERVIERAEGDLTAPIPALTLTLYRDYLENGSILLIEWSENIYGALPENTVFVSIEKGDEENKRTITIRTMAEE